MVWRACSAPLAARGFFESVYEHFQLRNDVDAYFTQTDVSDMRLRAVWEAESGGLNKQVFATLTWQPKNLAVFARTKLTPAEFSYLGFESVEKPKADSQPQNSEIRLYENDWRYRALPFICAIEAAKMKFSD